MFHVETNLIKSYTAYLRLERGLTENSISGYMNDLAKLLDF
ncbi:MAG: site-specific integrase, partial [Bacteroidales bacterium]